MLFGQYIISFKFIMLISYVRLKFTSHPKMPSVVLIFYNYVTGNFTLPRVLYALDVL